MKFSTLCMITTLLCSVWSSAGFAQSNGNAYGHAISISKTADLDFGQIVRSASSGTVALDAATSDRTFSGGISAGLNGGYHHAEFAVSGDKRTGYYVTLPSSISITHSTSSSSMVVNAFTSSLTNNIGTLGADGSDIFYVGGTLNVGATQQTGSYSGTFNVTVTYQ